MKGSYNRKKGHDFERICAKEFRELGWKDAITKRKARGGDWSESDGGEDLVNTGPFIVQCKNTKNYVSCNTIETIRKEKLGIPIVISNANNKNSVCVLYWRDMMKIISKLPKKE